MVMGVNQLLRSSSENNTVIAQASPTTQPGSYPAKPKYAEQSHGFGLSGYIGFFSPAKQGGKKSGCHLQRLQSFGGK